MYYEPYEPDRFKDYGWIPNDITDAFYAPSVADDCQGQGMGRLMMEEVLSTLKENGRTRILLWGGIQATHEKALAHHLKVGFQELGGFEWNGWNFDMALDMVSPEA